MSSALPDELYIAPRSQRPVGLGGAVLRALLVMAALDAALLFVAIDADSPAVSAGTHELQAEPARPEAPPPLETVTPPDERAPSPGSAEKAARKESAAPPVLKPPSGAESRGPAVQGVLAQNPPAPEPAPLAPPPNPIPAVATLPAEPPEATRARDPAVVVPTAKSRGPAGQGVLAQNPPAPEPAPLAPPPSPIPAVATLPAEPPEATRARDPAVVVPTAKPSPPTLPPKPVARQGAHRTQQRPDVAPLPSKIVATAEPRAVEIAERRREPPSCKPYTAQTTLAGDRLPVRGIACPEPDGGWRIVTERAERD